MIGPGALHRRLRLVVEDHRLPDQLARQGIEREDEVVDAGVDDQAAVDRDVAVVRGETADQLEDVLRVLAAVLPDEVAGHRVEAWMTSMGFGMYITPS